MRVCEEKEKTEVVGSKFIEGPNGLKIEYRFQNNDLDEIVYYHNDICILHLENLSELSWYLGIYLPGIEKNEHGLIPAQHAIQCWFRNLYVSSSIVENLENKLADKGSSGSIEKC